MSHKKISASKLNGLDFKIKNRKQIIQYEFLKKEFEKEKENE